MRLQMCIGIIPENIIATTRTHMRIQIVGIWLGEVQIFRMKTSRYAREWIYSRTGTERICCST